MRLGGYHRLRSPKFRDMRAPQQDVVNEIYCPLAVYVPMAVRVCYCLLGVGSPESLGVE